jgi:Tfp pilus assembly protein PilN
MIRPSLRRRGAASVGTAGTAEPAWPATATPPTALPRINLLPTSLVRARRRRRRQAGLAAIVLIAVALVLVGYVAAGDRLDAAQRRRELAVQRQWQVQQEVDQYAGVQATYQAVDASRATLQAALGTEVRYSRMLTALSSTVPASVQITSARWEQGTEDGAFGLSPGGLSPGTVAPPASATPAPDSSGEDDRLGTVTMSGLTSSYDDVATWLDALEHITGLAHATLLTATTVSGDTGVVRFTSTAVITTAALSGRYSGADGGLR